MTQISDLSCAERLARLSIDQRNKIIGDLNDQQVENLAYDWRFWGRPNQIAPDGDWSRWVILAGRGFGKTRAGSEWIREKVKGGCQRIALVAETQKDLEEVMIEGVSGILAVFPPAERPCYRKKPVKLTFPSGAIALGYNGTQPDQLRGPQFDTAWCDELAKWRRGQETWDQLQFGMRQGDCPQQLITTTPRPMQLIKDLIAGDRSVITRGSTFDNKLNLSADYIESVKERYGGTRLGRQELFGEVLEDLPGALWTADTFDCSRVDEAPDMARVVVAVDPSGTRGQTDGGDSIGIVIAGKGVDGRCYVLADRTCKLSPDGWGKRAVTAYHEFGADRIIAERNFGGAMVEHVIRSVDPNIAYSEVTASRGKVARAEPVAALYEQERVSHVGMLSALEDQACMFGSDGYTGFGSPDIVDALVWAISELMFSGVSEFNWYVGK